MKRLMVSLIAVGAMVTACDNSRVFYSKSGSVFPKTYEVFLQGSACMSRSTDGFDNKVSTRELPLSDCLPILVAIETKKKFGPCKVQEFVLSSSGGVFEKKELLKLDEDCLCFTEYTEEFDETKIKAFSEQDQCARFFSLDDWQIVKGFAIEIKTKLGKK